MVGEHNKKGFYFQTIESILKRPPLYLQIVGVTPISRLLSLF